MTKRFLNVLVVALVVFAGAVATQGAALDLAQKLTLVQTNANNTYKWNMQAIYQHQEYGVDLWCGQLLWFTDDTDNYTISGDPFSTGWVRQHDELDSLYVTQGGDDEPWKRMMPSDEDPSNDYISITFDSLHGELGETNMLVMLFDPVPWMPTIVQLSCTVPMSNVASNALPGEATLPFPTDEAGDVQTRLDLTWTPNAGASSHDVYFGIGTNLAAQGNQVAATFNPGVLANDTEYGWRIDEVNAGGTTTGTLWSFTTAEPIVTNAVFFSESLDSSPGWDAEKISPFQPGWAFGTPTGAGSHHGDPSSGYTGANVYGYNLGGDYGNNLVEALHLTTTSIDCSGFEDIVLVFWRKLGVEGLWDQAFIEASNDGSTWHKVWSSPSGTISDSTWYEMRYDISELADGQSNLKIRWGMGTSDLSDSYPGWNIDDIRLEGDVINYLDVLPKGAFASVGPVGGPFNMGSTEYTLSNSGTESLTWTTTTLSNLLAVTPVSGTLAAGETVPVTISFSAAADTLSAGVFSDGVVFSNTVSGLTETRTAQLEVLNGVIGMFTMDSDPGWSTEGDWEFGVPQGGGSFNGDPTEGFTGTNVYGYNLSGDYENDLPATYLTTDPFNCFGYGDIKLRFRRWLGVEGGTWDHASIQVSTDGATWSNVWDHTGVTLKDAEWIDVRLDVPALADMQTNVMFRWSMGPTDWLVTSPGWNIDDVIVSGTLLDELLVNPMAGFEAEGYEGGPFSPSNKVYTLENYGESNIAWSATVDTNWFTVAPFSGTLSAGDSTNLTLSLTAASDALGIASYDGVLRVINEQSGYTNTRAVVLNVKPIPGEIVVTDSIAPNTDLDMPFGARLANLPHTEQMTITNTDLTHDLILQDITVTPTGTFSVAGLPTFPYSVIPGDAITLDVIFAPETLTGEHAVLTIQSNDDDEPAVELTLSGTGIPDHILIEPEAPFESAGHPGGPFDPSSKDYLLENTGSEPMSWNATKTSAIFDLSPSNGTLPVGGQVTVTVSLNAQANDAEVGTYTDTVVFSNTTTTLTQEREVTLEVFISPTIEVSPGSFSVTNHAGGVLHKTLNIGNAAEADDLLSFVLRSRETGRDLGVEPMASTKAPNIRSGHDFTALAEGVNYSPNRILVRFEQGGLHVNGLAGIRAQQTATVQALGGQGVEKWFNIVPGLSVVTLPEDVSVEDALRRFNAAPGVLYAEPDYEHRGISTTPNDPRFSELWGMHNIGQTGGTSDADISAPEAWDISTGSRDVIVAVIDTGVDYTHPDLVNNMWVNTDEIPGNGLDDDGNGYTDDIYGYDFANGDADPMDDHFHGTHCAGTVGAEGNNGIGVAGVSWNVRIMAMKFLTAEGGGSTAHAISCIEYAVANGAKILSNSWGGGGYEQGLKDVIDAASDAGVVFVAAAGNSNLDNDVTPHYPSSYTSDNVLTVMATDHNDARSSFSQWGANSVDLGAPGTDILSCEPGGGYLNISGTSMATPAVAGACAVLLTANPSLTVADMKEALMSSVDPTLPGLCVSGGRMNLLAAIDAAGASWIDLSPDAKTGIAPGASQNVTVTFNADSLAPGTYEGDIVIQSSDVETPSTNIPCTMVVLDDGMRITPNTGFASEGRVGGSFVPNATVYTISNETSGAWSWSAEASESWITLSSSSGTLASQGVTNVTVVFNSEANALPVGVHNTTVMFRNAASGFEQLREVNLTVNDGTQPVLWDLTHGQFLGYGPSDEFSDFVSLIEGAGYPVSTTETGIENLDLSEYKILLISLVTSYYSPYTVDEVAAIETFVENGGALLVMAEDVGGGMGGTLPNWHIRPVTQQFNLNCGLSTLGPMYDVYLTNFTSHQIFDDCSNIFFRVAGELSASPPGIVVARNDESKPAIAVSSAGSGRVVLTGDCNLWDNYYITKEDNEQFALNVMEWLAGALAWPATSPSPADGAVGVESESVVMSWTPGDGVISHNLYLGTSHPLDGDDFIQNQTGTTYDPGGALEKDTTYYWRIDEVNAFGTNTGSEWSFTTSGLSITNAIPYAEPFESYSVGDPMLATEGWYSATPDAAVVSTNAAMIAALTGTYSGGFPITTNHTQVLRTTEPITNAIDSGSANIVKMDCILALKTGIAPELPSGEQTALWIDSDGRINILHADTDNGTTFTPEWLALTNSPAISSDEWMRVTVLLNYTDNMFQLRLNDGLPLSDSKGWNASGGTQPGTWFYMADRTRSALSHVSLSGETWLDDLVVEENAPPSVWTITASSGTHGSIAPSGDILVPTGGSTNFVLTPALYYHVADVLIDESNSAGAVTSYEFTNVTADHTIEGLFSADLATNDTPHWWLAQSHPDWTNNFDAHAENDFDGDGMKTWMERIAGTDATNAQSCFSVFVSMSNDNPVVTFQTIEAGSEWDGQSRWYSLSSASNLLADSWVGVGGFTNIPGTNQTVIYTNAMPSNAPAFFRGGVWLE